MFIFLVAYSYQISLPNAHLLNAFTRPLLPVITGDHQLLSVSTVFNNQTRGVQASVPEMARERASETHRKLVVGLRHTHLKYTSVLLESKWKSPSGKQNAHTNTHTEQEDMNTSLFKCKISGSVCVTQHYKIQSASTLSSHVLVLCV